MSELNRRAVAFAALAAFVLLAGCAGLGGPRVVTLGEAELARLLARQFPFDRRLLELVDVRVSAPRLTLLPERNRLGTELDVALSDRMLGRAVNGRLTMDTALRYDAQAQAVRLADVRVDTLALDGASSAVASAARRIGPLLAEQALDGLVIHRFTPDDLRRLGGVGLQPGAVTVTARGVEITLAPVR